MSSGHLCEAEAPTEAGAETLAPAVFYVEKLTKMCYHNGSTSFVLG